MTKPKGGKRPKGMTSHKHTTPDPRKPKGLKPGKTLRSKLLAALDKHPDLIDYLGTDNPRMQQPEFSDFAESPLRTRFGQGSWDPV